MIRRFFTLALAGLAAAAVGCRHCGERGWFASTHRGDDHGTLTGRPTAGEVCYDPVPGIPASGGFVGHGAPTTLIPSAAVPPQPGVRPDELPYPQPSDLIPRPGVPLAPPSAAPGDGSAGVLPAPRAGVSVKGTK